VKGARGIARGRSEAAVEKDDSVNYSHSSSPDIYAYLLQLASSDYSFFCPLGDGKKNRGRMEKKS